MDVPAFCLCSLGDQGGSGYYRAVQPLWTCTAHGYLQVRVPNQMVFFPKEDIQKMRPDTIVFHRAHTTAHKHYIKQLIHQLEEVEELNLDILKVYTIDDWVGTVPKDSPHYKDIPHNVDSEIKKVIYHCDRLVVTTDILRGVYGNKKDTYVIPNYLSEAVWNPIYHTERGLRKSDIPRIGWSGGMGHPGDLAILKQIADILGDSVRWVFLGDTPKGFDDGNSEIHKGVQVLEYPKALYDLDLDLALAPLINNDFNRAKSDLRVLEYGACGYPVIASNVLTYKNTPATLIDYKAEWWAETIKEKLKDREALKAEGNDLKKWVWETHKLEDHLEEWATVMSPDKKPYIPYVSEKTDIVDILITTHNNLETVKLCVESVLESLPHNKTKVNVVVSDNASTEDGLKRYLQLLKTRNITVIEREKDEGYIVNINEAIKTNRNNDVICLNSDTWVHDDWIDRIRDTAYSHERIATVTPWSNNATLVSFPDIKGSALEPAFARFYDSVAKEALPNPIPPRIVTPVGFCMYMKRKMVAELGLFDPHAFGKGYGDENDWAMRALIKGYTHALATNVYVGHAGGLTFGPEKQKLLEASAPIIVARWPQYPQLIDQWFKTDPLRALRQQFEVESISESTLSPRTLFISHSYGGGLETYVQSQLEKNPNSVVMRNNPSQNSVLSFEFLGESYTNLPILDLLLSPMDAAKNLLTKFKVNHISVQTTFGYDYTLPMWIMNLVSMMGITYSVMLHDYWTICPRLRLIQTTSYCGEPTVEDCNKCVMTYGSGVGQVDVGDWRYLYYRFLKNATDIYAPSNDLANRINKYFQDINIQVVPHETDIQLASWKGYIPFEEGNELRIAVIGNLTADKGSLIVRDCAKYCLENSLKVKFLVFGSLLEHSAQMKPIAETENLRIFGLYKDDSELRATVELNPCNISFHPSLWPETYSYTLSHAFRFGLNPVCYDIGAPAERIREMGFGFVIPLEYSKDIAKTVNTLINYGTKSIWVE